MTKTAELQIPKIEEPDWTPKANLLVSTLASHMTGNLRQVAIDAVASSLSLAFTQGSAAALEVAIRALKPAVR